MATTLFTLLDDIASLLDDMAVLSKAAASKTAGVLGDDLALNAQQVSGVRPERELPVVWAVAKGSLINKAILVPLALLISAFKPAAIVPLLIIGGAYLCFEGVEKLVHKFLHRHDAQEKQQHQAELVALSDPAADLVALEKDKIRGAIRTDFILSAEIIVIALGSITAAGAGLGMQIGVLTTIALAMTVGVYGLVAGIVKIDDLGLHLSRRQGSTAALSRRIGQLLLLTAPLLMKTLSVVGTIAMFLVGGGILSHNIAALHHTSGHMAATVAQTPVIGGLLHVIVPSLLDIVLGLIVGALVLLVVQGVSVLRKAASKPAN